jgi:vacuolar-type H+-ATPase subunit I/STV1
MTDNEVNYLGNKMLSTAKGDSEAGTQTLHDLNQAVNAQTNTVASVIFFIGIVEIVAGLFLGFYFGYNGNEIRWSITSPIWVMGFVSGMMLIGFSEVIKLLHSIRQKLNK